jgi:hypothetical protein
MNLYRVTFTTSLIVEAESERDAERIGHVNLKEESSIASELYSIDRIEFKDELRRDERGSLPWRDARRRDEPELYVEELLGE